MAKKTKEKKLDDLKHEQPRRHASRRKHEREVQRRIYIGLGIVLALVGGVMTGLPDKSSPLYWPAQLTPHLRHPRLPQVDGGGRRGGHLAPDGPAGRCGGVVLPDRYGAFQV